MSRALAFRPSTLDRALAAAEKRGLKVSGYEITPDGTIRILTAETGAPVPSAETAEDAWDRALGLQ